MFWFRPKISKQYNESLGRLEQKLKELSGIPVPNSLKNEFKQTLLSEFEAKAPLQNNKYTLKDVVNVLKSKKQVYPSVFFEISLKERLLNKSIHIKNEIFTFLNIKRAASLALVLVFFVFSSFLFFIKTPSSYAKKITYISDLQGNVQIERNGGFIDATDKMLLKEGDTIKTLNFGKASIYFFDDSICRLSEDTVLKIEDLFQNPYKPVETSVGLKLTEGRVWTRVVNLVDDSSEFSLKAGEATAFTSHKAAFDVKVSKEGEALIKVLQNNVDVKIDEEGSTKAISVAKGESVKVITENNQNIVFEEQENEETDENDNWIASNLDEDKGYMVGLNERDKLEATEKAGILPEDLLYPVKKISEDVKLSVTFGDADKELFKLEIASKRLFEAEVLINEGKIELAYEKINEYKNILTEVYEKALVIEDEDPQSAVILKEKINENLRIHKKRLTSILPDSSLYKAKEAISEMEMSITENDVDKNILKSEQSSEKLLEVDALLENGSNNEASEHLDKYKEDLKNVLEGIESLSDEEKEEAITILVEEKKKELGILNGIENAQEYSAAIKKKLKSIKKEIEKELEKMEAAQDVEEKDTGCIHCAAEESVEEVEPAASSVIPATPETEVKVEGDVFELPKNDQDTNADAMEPVSEKVVKRDIK